MAKTNETVNTLNTNLESISSELTPLYSVGGSILQNMKALVGTIKIPYLDGATLYTSVDLNNAFSSKDSMIAFATLYGEYNVERCHIVTQIESVNRVNLIVRADTGTTFVNGTAGYASLLVIGK